MPKTVIDYSNTIIYKITCKNQTVTDVYVGHTTNFVQRKHAHKQSCINIKSTNYTCKLYEVIRNNGGWSNWQMEIVNFFNCSSHYEARIKEQEYFVLLNATLNSIEPLPPKPIAAAVKTEIIQPVDNDNKYNCINCNFKCSNKNDFRRHMSTRKHILNNNLNDVEQKHSIKLKHFTCVTCEKVYPSRNGLWYHKKKCSQQPVATPPAEPELTNSLSPTHDNVMIFELLKQNREFKDLIIEQNKIIMELAGKVGNTTIHTV